MDSKRIAGLLGKLSRDFDQGFSGFEQSDCGRKAKGENFFQSFVRSISTCYPENLGRRAPVLKQGHEVAVFRKNNDVFLARGIKNVDIFCRLKLKLSHRVCLDLEFRGYP